MGPIHVVRLLACALGICVRLVGLLVELSARVVYY